MAVIYKNGPQSAGAVHFDRTTTDAFNLGPDLSDSWLHVELTGFECVIQASTALPMDCRLLQLEADSSV